MIVCPNCQTPSYFGTFFCPECGTRLPLEGGQATYTLSQNGPQTTREAPPEAPRTETAPGVTLIVVKNNRRMPLAGAICSIGRVDRAQAVVPELDLNPHGGYEQGVSRLHATFHQDQGMVTITDLGSANGTFLNGRRLEPHRACTLQHGDLLAFGKLEAIVSFGPGSRLDPTPTE